MVGLFNTPTYTTVNYIIRSNPSGIAIRDSVPNSTAVLYYTLYDSTTTGYILYKENIDLKFNYSNQVKTSINKNWGSVISVTPDILVVVCPSTSSASNGMFSVYNESDLSLITTVTATTGLYWISLQSILIKKKSNKSMD